MKVSKIAGVYDKILGVISGILLFFFFAMILGTVLCRQVFKISLVWFDELSTYSFMWMVFLSGALAFMEDSHFKVEILPPKLMQKLETPLHYMEIAVLGIYALIMLYFGIKFSIYNANVNTLTLHLPVKILTLCIPISAALTLISVILRECMFIQNHRSGGRKATKESEA